MVANTTFNLTDDIGQRILVAADDLAAVEIAIKLVHGATGRTVVQAFRGGAQREWQWTTERRQAMEKSTKVFIGMDVHKESLDITLAEVGGEVRRLGQIGGHRGSLPKMVRRQQSQDGEQVFVFVSFVSKLFLAPRRLGGYIPVWDATTAP